MVPCEVSAVKLGASSFIRKMKDPPGWRALYTHRFDGSNLASEGVCGGCGDRENLALTRENFLGVSRAGGGGNRVFAVLFALRTKSCVFGAFALDRNSTCA